MKETRHTLIIVKLKHERNKTYLIIVKLKHERNKTYLIIIVKLDAY